jgi:hypothetical protein
VLYLNKSLYIKVYGVVYFYQPDLPPFTESVIPATKEDLPLQSQIRASANSSGSPILPSPVSIDKSAMAAGVRLLRGVFTALSIISKLVFIANAVRSVLQK